LGYMFFACGCSTYHIALFHLFNHAFFKALLFLGAGFIIHACSNERDMRYFGGFVNFLPFTYVCFVIGSLAIMGFPFLAGFYSKELIFEFGLCRYVVDSSFMYLLIWLAAINTTIYSWRILIYVFFNRINKSVLCLNEANPWMFVPVLCLALCSIFVGYIFSDFMIGYGGYGGNSIFILPWNFEWLDVEHLNLIVHYLPLMASFIGFLLAFSAHYCCALNKNIWFTNIFVNFFRICYNGFFFNICYNYLFLVLYQGSYLFIAKSLDKGALEFWGPYGLYKFFYALSYKSRLFTPYLIVVNLCFMFLGVSVLLWFVIFENLSLEFFGILYVCFFFELGKKR